MTTNETTPADLEKTLEELHQQLLAVEDPNERTIELIAQVRGDLNRIGQENDAGEGLLERIEEAASGFNTEHPVLANSLRRIADFLSGAGI